MPTTSGVGFSRSGQRRLENDLFMQVRFNSEVAEQPTPAFFCVSSYLLTEQSSRLALSADSGGFPMAILVAGSSTFRGPWQGNPGNPPLKGAVSGVFGQGVSIELLTRHNRWVNPRTWWSALDMDVETLLKMMKGALPPVLCIAM